MWGLGVWGGGGLFDLGRVGWIWRWRWGRLEESVMEGEREGGSKGGCSVFFCVCVFLYHTYHII